MMMSPSPFLSTPTNGESPQAPQRGSRSPVWMRELRRGALIGFGTGLLALGVTLMVAWRCLPFYITYPATSWPWYCTQPAYSMIVFLAFPINLITHDLAQSVVLAPLSLLFYTIAGALIGAVLRWLRLRSRSRNL
ncbi:MAG: hypothetical protein AB1457_12210 [Chloroflexota bacterium]